MVVAGSPFGAWDNSTRGLDSASALNFIEALRKSCDLGSHANAVSIYQASQSIYDLFDKATVLYEGRQIYFGPAAGARQFFERQGWHCPPRQTTGDFLTSITNPSERRARAGMEAQVPRTAGEFERYWRASPEFMALMGELDEYDSECCGEHQKESIAQLRQQKNFRQDKRVRAKSPYTIGIWMQVRLNCKRAYQRIWNDMTATAASTLIQVVLAIILGTIFVHTPDTTDGFFAKGAILFTAVLLSALVAILEVTNLYSQRPIVEKHASYAFYHPFTEAAAGIVLDIPLKLVTSIFFNTILYFMAGLRREPGPFFLFFLITYVAGFVMTAAFRTIAAITKTVSQAMTLAGVMVLALVIYSGFIITVPEMHPWFGWIRWVNPIFYAFEILVANEFHNRQFRCAARSLVPAYQPLVGDSWICGVTGAIAGQMMVSGDAFIEENYHYHWSHVWRNFGILLAFLALFMVIYFLATELNSSPSSTRAESLVFRRGHVPPQLLLNSHAQPAMTEDERASKPADALQDPRISDVGSFRPHKDIFAWKNVVLDIMIKDEKRRLLDHVDGWVKPGTLTALMGVSGAGKTTLLDVLAQRSTVGVISGDMLVNGRPRDLHVHTDTVRESLRFSAMLRRPSSVSKDEKYAFVEEVIKMLNMEEFANAVVGVPGQGLNLEQRKLLTIGVELAAKPELLLFLDEPTSGLDSQSSWAICAFLRKLADSGQAILCTVHQPSAVLFQQFDRLLFLAEGGKTVYFGDVGDNSQTLLGYFEGNGARKCGDAENPAEYMIEIVNEGANDTGMDWHSLWRDSPEYRATRAELDRIHAQKLGGQQSANREETEKETTEAAVSTQFAMPLSSQMFAVTARMLRQYWRSPSYIMAKVMLGVSAGLFVGFTFYNAKTTLAGMQNIIFSIFMLASIFTTLVQQIHPVFIAQRDLYEVRERPSKTYSWVAFIVANLFVEIPYQVVTAVLTYACIYFPIVGAGQSALRQGLVFLCIMQLFVFASAFAHMTIVWMPDEQTAASIVAFVSTLSLIFSGVLETPDALPAFWRQFLYRVSPFTYWISTIVSTSLHGRPVVCSQREMSVFNPPANLTCGEYLAPYLRVAPGHLQNPMDTSACRYCAFTVADQSIELSRIRWSEKWRNYGIMWGYIGFNLLMAILLYYVFRVRQWKRKSVK
ncbi:ATP-binding cassette transporter CGR1 [Escovopsis weberi]|uniref:ATP-binding cassette transporter CGR1 n=1 Tax=Escovopsis weberi TaxID=150374 RepID=A0A0M8MXC9_ESCWE|nr:ATP-binding cassette transporter CGR1 [Escovopsis weberi]